MKKTLNVIWMLALLCCSAFAVAQGTLTSAPVSALPFKRTETATVTQTLRQQLEAQPLNVKNFGAVGDGSHDDTSAIQSAIDYVTSLQGGVIYFPLGIYKTTAQLNVKISGIILRGAQSAPKQSLNRGSVIWYQGRGNEDAVRFWSGVNGTLIYQVGVRDLGISGAYGATYANSSGVHFIGCSEIIFDQCYVTYGFTSGLRITSCSIMQIYNPYVAGCTDGILLDINAVASNQNNSFICMNGSNIWDCTEASLKIFGSAELRITDAWMERAQQNILIQGATDSDTVVDLWCRGCHFIASKPYTNTRLLKAMGNSGSSYAFKIRNLVMEDCVSYQTGSDEHIEILKNGNTNSESYAKNVTIQRGQYEQANLLLYTDFTNLTGQCVGFITARNAKDLTKLHIGGKWDDLIPNPK